MFPLHAGPVFLPAAWARAVRFCQWLGHLKATNTTRKYYTIPPSVPSTHTQLENQPHLSIQQQQQCASPHSQQSRTAPPAHIRPPTHQAMTGPPLSDLKQRLERKATFEAAVKELTGAHSDAAALDLVPRVYTLLKARHTSPAAWKAGLELFRAVQVRVLQECMETCMHACVDRLSSKERSVACIPTTDN